MCRSAQARRVGAVKRALEKYPGTPIFVSHYCEFVSSLATRIIELTPGRKPGDAATVIDFQGSYEDYLAGAGAELAAA